MFELEADSTTIPSEYVLLRHYLAEPVDSAVLEGKIANYLRRTQGTMAAGRWCRTARST